jgi:DNA topoisomerase-1
VRVLEGRYGPYITDGTLNATVPRGLDPAQITLDEAMGLLRAKAEKGPSKPRKATKKAAKKATKKVAKKATKKTTKKAAKKTVKKAAKKAAKSAATKSTTTAVQPNTD